MASSVWTNNCDIRTRDEEADNLNVVVRGRTLQAGSHPPKPANAPEFLSFDELVTLSDTDQPAVPLAEKLNRLLTTPFLSNGGSLLSQRPHRPSVNGLGPVLRVASWNVERGLNFDLIRLALSDPDGFR